MTDLAVLPHLLAAQQANRWRIARTTVAERRAKLARLAAAITAHRADILAAGDADFGKPATEVEFAEVMPILEEIRHARRHLARWMRPRRVPTPLVLFGTRSEIRSEPRGVVLILAPWNYAFSLCVAPLVAAIAAGNCAVVKPSEKAPHTAALLATLLGGLFPPDEVAVVEGGPDAAEALVHLPFDHIFFTGGTRVARWVMGAAARHLTSVTLELGGKSPVIVDESADLRAAAERIVWAKCWNAGQTCVAPDYALVHRSHEAAFLAEARRALAGFLGGSEETRAASPDLCRVVDDAHLARLQGLVDAAVAAGATVVVGGRFDAATRYAAPTILTGVTLEMPVMQEEIFGPVLPVLTYDDLDEALARIRPLGKPLALYVFSARRAVFEHVLATTTAGGSAFNTAMLQYANPYLPFGGVGGSGMGAYHGEHGFRCFSHERAVLRQGWPALIGTFFPPYAGWLPRLTRRALRLRD